MKMNLTADRSTIVVGCSVAAVLLLSLYWVLQFWFLRQEFVGEIEALQPRTSRHLGMVESFDDLVMASVAADNVLSELAYPVDRESAMTAAAMQQEIRELMTDAGVSISGSQILPVRKLEGFDRLSLDISVEGNIDALDEALSSLELMRPLVFVDSVKVKPAPRRRVARRAGRPQPAAADDGDPRKLSARFRLFSLRLKE